MIVLLLTAALAGFAPPSTIPLPAGVFTRVSSQPAILDLDGDGHLDVLVDLTSATDEGLQAVRGNGMLPLVTGPWPVEFDLFPVQWSHTFGAISVGDLDGDGKQDFVGAESLLFPGTSDGVGPWWPVADNAFGAYARSVGGDFDGDGYADVASIDPFARGIQVHFGSATGPAGGRATMLYRGFDARLDLAVSDLDGDGFDDLIILYDPTPGGPTLIAERGSANGLGAVAWDYFEPPDDATRIVGGQDWDGDGLEDVLVVVEDGTSSDKIRVWSGSPGGFGARIAAFDSGVEVGPVGWADFDGDGQIDVLCGEPAFSGGGRVNAGRLVLLNLRAGRWVQGWTYAGTSAQQAIGKWFAIGDLDEDGLPDVVSSDAVAARVFRSLPDADGDGSPDNEDCNDANAGVYPGALEVIADGIDQDCDGLEACAVDGDGDSWGHPTLTATSSDFSCGPPYASRRLDCDDNDAGVNPAAPEIVGDSKDQNCDGVQECFEDIDGDGWGSDQVVRSAFLCGFQTARRSGDCDDTQREVNPDATEIPGNRRDEDCDGLARCLVDRDDDGSGVMDLAPLEECAARTTADRDCDDANGSVYPGAEEVPGNGIDDDCDGQELCWVDEDGDGFGGPYQLASNAIDCSSLGLSAITGDCFDGDASMWPGAPEACDGIDADCDGDLLDGLPDRGDGTPRCAEAHGGCACVATPVPAADLRALLFVAMIVPRRRRR